MHAHLVAKGREHDIHVCRAKAVQEGVRHVLHTVVIGGDVFPWVWHPLLLLGCKPACHLRIVHHLQKNTNFRRRPGIAPPFRQGLRGAAPPIAPGNAYLIHMRHVVSREW